MLADVSPTKKQQPERYQHRRDPSIHTLAESDLVHNNNSHARHSISPPHPHVAHLHMSEHTPLLQHKSQHSPSSRWLFWRPSSPSFRFFILALAMLIPFGPHLVKSCLSSLASYFLSSPTFPITHTQFGSFQSALSLPNLFIPFLGGLLLDLRGSPSGTLLFLAFTLVGHTLFTLACQAHSYPSALVPRALFGLGQGSTVVAQGRIAAVYFRGHEMVFAIAVCESLHNLSALIARLYVVPMAEWSGTYIASLWVGVAACALSMVAGLVFWYIDPHVRVEEQRLTAEQTITAARNGVTVGEDEEASELPDEAVLVRTADAPSARMSTSISTDSIASNASVTSTASSASTASFTSMLQRRALPISFIMLCLLHLVHSNSYHLFDYISADFLQTKYDTTIMHSAVLSSITSCAAIVLCPIAGYVLDHTGHKSVCCALSITYRLLVVSSFVWAEVLSAVCVCVCLVQNVCGVPLQCADMRCLSAVGADVDHSLGTARTSFTLHIVCPHHTALSRARLLTGCICWYSVRCL